MEYFSDLEFVVSVIVMFFIPIGGFAVFIFFLYSQYEKEYLEGCQRLSECDRALVRSDAFLKS